ncbi:translation initiation factor IF-3 [bacterium]|nr:translation initiation factor IF-3 [bacterium]
MRINNKIRAASVRVIDDEGKQIGVLEINEALALADVKGLDLVEVGGKSDPPVCRIMDFGKFKYQQSKKIHDAKKKQTVIRIKEIKLRPKTEIHDFQFKLKNAIGFLEHGNKVKVTIQYRGREMAFTHMGIELLKKFADEAQDVGDVESYPRAEGRTTFMILTPKKIEKK